MLIRGISKSSRFIILDSKNIVEKALEIHKASPTAIAAFGRLLTATSMMGSDLKGDRDVISLRIDSDGILNQMVVTSDSTGNVKGYLSNPEASLPLNEKNKLDVSGIIGKGFLKVIKDMGLKEPYNGVVPLQTGEIAEDLAYYFFVSEQIPSVVALGVLVDETGIKQAGGFMIQLLPNAEDDFISKLEEKIKSIKPVTELLEGGMDIYKIAKLLYEDMENPDLNIEDYKILEEKEVEYICNCNKEKFFRGLISLGKEEIKSIFSKQEEIQTECHFCKKLYSFKKEDFELIFN